MKLLPYLLIVAAGATAVPTLIAAFTGEATNWILVTLSASLLLLALVSLPFRQRSEIQVETTSR